MATRVYFRYFARASARAKARNHSNLSVQYELYDMRRTSAVLTLVNQADQ